MHIVIIEDEPIVAKRVQRLSAEILGDRLAKLKWFNNLDDALDYLAEHPIDLLLLDLNINGRNGFDVLKTAVSKSFQTIIISAYSEQAITAFEYGVLDFVNKPYSKLRLERALDRFLDNEEKSSVKTKYLAIKINNEVELINVNDIQYLQGANIYSEIILNDGSIYLHDKSLSKLVAILPPVFQRVHKSYIVKVSEIKKMITHKGSKYELQLKAGGLIPVGRTFYKTVQKNFN